MIEKKTIIDQVEVLACGRVQLRLQKVVADGDDVILQEPHRTAFEPDTPVDMQLAAVNKNLADDLGYPALDTNQRDYIKTLVASGRGAASKLAGKADARLCGSARSARTLEARLAKLQPVSAKEPSGKQQQFKKVDAGT